MINFTEIEHWGFNALTTTALITMFFTVFQGYGVLKQNQKIWRTQSGTSLSATLFFLYCFYFIAFFFYGLHKNSLAMTFNGLLALPYIPIVIGLLKFKRLTKGEKISLPLTMAIVPIMIFISDKDLWLLILLLISLIVLCTQPLAMLKTKTRGAVDIKFIYIFSITSVFWLIYALIINNWVLTIFNIVALVIYALIIYLYRHYEP